MTGPTIRRGDWVTVTDGPWAGRRGQVARVMRADRHYDRRADVAFPPSIGHQVVRLDWLAPDPDPDAGPP